MKSAVHLVLMLAAALTLGFAIRGILGTAADDMPESLVLADDTAVPSPSEHPAEHLQHSPDGTIHYLFQPPQTDTLPSHELTAPSPAKTPGPLQPPYDMPLFLVWDAENPGFASGWTELKEVHRSRNREEHLRLQRPEAEVFATEETVASILSECDAKTRVCSLALIDKGMAEQVLRRTAAERADLKQQEPQYDVKYAIVWDSAKKTLVFDNWEKSPMRRYKRTACISTFGNMR